MKTQKTQLVGTEFTYTMNPDLTKHENFLRAKQAGFPAGKTGFTNLVNGVIKETKGVKLVVTTESPKTKAKKAVKKVKIQSKNTQALTGKVAEEALKALGLEGGVNQSTRKTYLTTHTSVGRLLVTALADGSFRVTQRTYREYTAEDAAKLLGSKTSDVHVRTKDAKATLTADQVVALTK